MSRRDAVARGRQPRIELGDEPALSEADGLDGLDRRRVSGRWLVGTILTGIAGAALLGGALYACLDRQSSFAIEPERTAEDGDSPGAVTGRKSDRMAAQPNARFSFKQTLHLDTVTRVGEREFIRVKPFVRISAPLALMRTQATADLPAFNPLKLFEDREQPIARSAKGRPEGEVSLVLRDLDDRATLAPLEPSPGELDALVRDAAQFGVREAPRMLAAFAPADGFLTASDALATTGLGFPGTTGLAAYGSTVRTWAENVTVMSKSARAEAGPALEADERIVTVQKGDTLAALLVASGATPSEAQAMTEVMREGFPAEKLREGLKLRLSVSAAEDDRTRMRPVRVSLFEGDEHKGTVALSDNGTYVALEDPGDFSADADAVAEEDEDESPAVTLYTSLYETGAKLGLPKGMVDSLVRIYSYDVDFQRAVRPGDSLEIFYSADNPGEILYTALTLKDEARRYYRFEDDGDDSVDFYDETGKSSKKFLLGKPMVGGSLSSGFGMRRHPILRYAKMHTGVDWRAPRGTPILAAGEGTVEKAGWESGYGRYVRIRHTNGYQTAYGHMSGFAKGISPGTRVRQGQVIGYVGSTGMSTGNHLHYEVLINERLVNPLRIKLPQGRTLAGEALERFQRERERVDTVMNRAPAVSRITSTGG